MRKTDRLNGLKTWWNRLCKPKYRVTIPAEELKRECISGYERTGSVEMPWFCAKDNVTHIFLK